MAGTLTFCGRITRVCFVLSNIILCVVGVTAVGAGGYVMYIGRLEGSPLAIMVTGIILIIAGLLMTILVMIGILGAVCTSKIVLGQYIVCVGIVILMALVGGILCFIYGERIPSILHNEFNKAIQNYRSENDPDFKHNMNALIDFLQSKAQCCGWMDAQSDWEQAPFFTINSRYPNSCLCTQPGSCVYAADTDQHIWNKVCKTTAVSMAKAILSVVGAIGTFSAIFLVVPAIQAIILILTIRDEYKSLTV